MMFFHEFNEAPPVLGSCWFMAAAQALLPSRHLIRHRAVHIDAESLGESTHRAAIEGVNPDRAAVFGHLNLIISGHAGECVRRFFAH